MDTPKIVEAITVCLRQNEYESAGQALGLLIDEKRRQYGGGALERAAAVMTLLYPDGIQPEHYCDAMSLMRVVEKLCRVAGGNQGDEDAWIDIAGHGLVAGAISAKRRESEPALGTTDPKVGTL